MPARALRVCRRCSTLTSHASGMCDAHQVQVQEQEKARKADPLQRMYGLADWRVTRAIVFGHDPFCAICRTALATDCDHHPLSAREIVAKFGRSEFFNPARCRGLCKSCHSAKTWKEGR